MSHDVHRQALAEVRQDIAALEQHLADLNLQLGELRAVERYHASKVEGAPTGAAPPSENGTISPAAETVEAVPDFSKMTLREAAYAVLRRARTALTTRQVTDAALQGGYKTTKPESLRDAVFALLTRSNEVKKVGVGLWEWKGGQDKDPVVVH